MLDEATTLQNRLLSFEKWISGIYASLTINDDENKSNEEEVSILNLPSLKRGINTFDATKYVVSNHSQTI